MKKIILLLLVTISAVSVRAQTEVNITEKMYGPNWFSDLTKAKADPDKVFYLDLSFGGESGAKLTKFPIEITTAFPNLKELYLGYNKFTSLPDEIGNIKTLEILDISGNYLMTKLPEGLKNLTGLKELDVKDHKFLPQTEMDKLKVWLPNAKIVTE